MIVSDNRTELTSNPSWLGDYQCGGDDSYNYGKDYSDFGTPQNIKDGNGEERPRSSVIVQCCVPVFTCLANSHQSNLCRLI
jgi:hypothetical protein